jgi:hypothetical protein
MDAQLFQADVILPSQFLQTPRRTGEWKLLVDILDDAIACFKRYVLTGDRRCREAEQWIMTSDEGMIRSDGSDAFFSFEYVCAVLDLDPVYLRRGLRRWCQLRRPMTADYDEV